MTDRARITELECAIIPLAKQADFYKPEVPDYEQVRVPLQFLRAARAVMPGTLPDIEDIIDGTFTPSPPALSGEAKEAVQYATEFCETIKKSDDEQLTVLASWTAQEFRVLLSLIERQGREIAELKKRLPGAVEGWL